MSAADPHGASEPNDAAAAAIARGLEFLAGKQAKDGGWHSESYGSMRGGAAITGLVVDSLSRLDARTFAKYREQFTAGLTFLCSNVDEHGCPRNADRTVDYPTYAAALALAAIGRTKIDPNPQARERMLDYLLKIQLNESRGFPATDENHGGWELTGALDMRSITTGSNVSITSYALDALSLERGDRVAVAQKHALAWLGRCQNYDDGKNGIGEKKELQALDGGFFFQVERNSDSNKAQWADEKHRAPRSYGTATADGLRGLLAAGKKADDPAVKAAVAWLTKHDDTKQVPGFEKAPKGLGWPQGLRFYYYCSLSKIFDALPKDVRQSRRVAILQQLLAAQKKDGSWVNDAHHMRENDPLIATSLIVETLARCVAAEKR